MKQLSIMMMLTLLIIGTAQGVLQEHANSTGEVTFGIVSLDNKFCQRFAVGITGEDKSYPVDKFGFDIRKSSGDLTQDVVFSLETGAEMPTDVLQADTISQLQINAELTGELQWYYWTPSVQQTLNQSQDYWLCIYYNGDEPNYIQMAGASTDYGSSSYNFWHTSSGGGIVDIPFQVWEDTNISICTPEWDCSAYDVCQSDDYQYCNAVLDINECGVPYEGNYSEYTPLSCDFCTPTWTCTGYEACVDPMAEAVCNEVEDGNTCGEEYSGDYSEFDAQSCVYPPSTPQNNSLTGYVPAHSSSDVGGLVVDFSVEFGMQMVALAGLVALVGLGVWAMRIL
jgi:hypothetical protein